MSTFLHAYKKKGINTPKLLIQKGFLPKDETISGELQFSRFENGCHRRLLLNKVQNADEGSPQVGFKPELLPVNQLFRISHQF